MKPETPTSISHYRKMPDSRKVAHLIVDASGDGQRVDNFLCKHLKGVPKSRIYSMLSSGEARLNGRRIKAKDRVHSGDTIRIPPLNRLAPKPLLPILPTAKLPPVVFEDKNLLVINKPKGEAVHGGSGIHAGVIEQLRPLYPDFLALAHRIDRETSGLLLLAKSRPALLSLHQTMQSGQFHKTYLALVYGKPQKEHFTIEYPLLRQKGHVTPSSLGQMAKTEVHYLAEQKGFSLLDVRPITGKMHQIRVHLAQMGLPIVGDSRYGDFSLNRSFKAHYTYMRLFLHAFRLEFPHPQGGQLSLEAPLWPEETNLLGSFFPEIRRILV